MAVIAIIGAGLAGLAAACELSAAGHRVTLFEKSRGVGGRAATRRVEGVRFDHGLQYVKSPTAAIADLLQASGGAIDIGRPVWIFDQAGHVQPGDPELNAEPKWTWPDGVTALAKYLAQGLDVRFEATVTAIRTMAEGGYGIDLAGAERPIAAEAVLLTAPAAQSAAILRAGDLPNRRLTELTTALDGVMYRRCISLTMAFANRPQVPWYALVNIDRGHAISWLACEHDKPGRAAESLGLMTAQMADSWSVANWESMVRGQFAPDSLPEPAQNVPALIEALSGQSLGAPLWVNVQRWRYALPDNGLDADALNAAGDGIYLAGDMAAGQGRAHLAIESGWHTARLMIEHLR
ncbi:MAG: NAD(P)-binding protein [Oscillochloris sp.]|nr:NAD(P)-binding protein [Oscillochloris sp.]